MIFGSLLFRILLINLMINLVSYLIKYTISKKKKKKTSCSFGNFKCSNPLSTIFLKQINYFKKFLFTHNLLNHFHYLSEAGFMMMIRISQSIRFC